MSVKNCNQCEKVFASSSSLSHHKRSHNKSDIVTCELLQITCHYILLQMATICNNMINLCALMIPSSQTNVRSQKSFLD